MKLYTDFCLFPAYTAATCGSHSLDCLSPASAKNSTLKFLDLLRHKTNAFSLLAAAALFASACSSAPPAAGDKGEPRYSQYYGQVRSLLEASFNQEVKRRHLDLGQKLRKHPDCLKGNMLIATMKADGSLADAYVQPPSCSAAIDRALVGAAKAAVPYPPPPPSLLQDGVVRISWDFVVRK